MRISTTLISTMVFALSAAGQTASIAGKVMDVDGKPVQMTPIQATNTASKKVFKATSSEKGEYSIGQLPAGSYDVTATVSIYTFAPFRKLGVAVANGQALRLDIKLQDGVTLNTLGEDRDALAL